MNNSTLHQPLVRILANIVIFLAVCVAPWWFCLILLCIGMFVFKNFYESLAIALFLDGFHGAPGAAFFGTNTFFITITGVAFIVSIFLKTRLRFYQ